MRLRMEGVHLVFFRAETSDWARLDRHGRPADCRNDDYDKIEFTVSSQLRTDTQPGMMQLLRRLTPDQRKQYRAYFVDNRHSINATQDRVVLIAVRALGFPKMGANTSYIDGKMVREGRP